MRKRLVLTAVLAGLTALFALDAGAMPFAIATHGFGSGDITLVRDGCGPGFRYSYNRQGCVPDEGFGRGVRACPPGFRFSDYRQRCVPVERVAPGCPPGTRFSEYRQRCVPF